MAPRNTKNSSQVEPQPSSSQVNSGVDSALVDVLNHSIGQLRSTLENISLSFDSSTSKDVNGVIKNLISAVQNLTNNLSGLQNKMENLENRFRSQEDQMDEIAQRGMKGNLIVTSLPNKNKGKFCLIKTPAQLKEENLSVTSHIISLVKDKFGVVLPAEDITACHHLPKGGVVLRIHNRKEGSAWESIIQKMKEGVRPDLNVFFNFQLTKRRSNLLFEVRKLKKDNKLSKFFTDENGHIKIRIGANDKDKHRITYFWDKGVTVTLHKEELLNLVHSLTK